MSNKQPIFDKEARHPLVPGGPILIAGPCSAESRTQILKSAEALASNGVRIFRAGVWKPRTRPGSFEGFGEDALEWLSEAKATTGMRVITEVGSPEHLQKVAATNLDGFWIGARTTANPFLVQEIANEYAALPQEKRDKMTVLVKNPVNPDLELWIGAIERMLGAGAKKIGAIHRGFSVYSPLPAAYRNAPLWPIPIELHRRYPNLPLIFDPSHTGGKALHVGPLSSQALQMGFKGLMIEVHPTPAKALSDPLQQITPDEFISLVSGLSCGADSPREADLSLLREEIDSVDRSILELLARRMEISKRIGEVKKTGGLSIVQPSRYAKMIDERTTHGAELNLPATFVRKIFSTIHEQSVDTQLQ